jgi:predicted RNA-binding Zn ribbon-like protein
MIGKGVEAMPGPQAKTDWKDGFLFIGNQVALDFVNTRPVQNGEPIELLPDFASLLRWFQAVGLLTTDAATKIEDEWGRTARAEKTIEVMREFREKLRKEILALEQGRPVARSTIEELNRLLTEHPMRTRLIATRQGHASERWFQVREPEDLIAPLAHSAVSLLVELDRQRIRKCAECVLHFHDTSKKGTRRWCSMQLCGNRHKVAAYAARQRQR